MQVGGVRLRDDQGEPVRGERDGLVDQPLPEEALRVQGRRRGEDVRRRAIPDLRLERVRAGEAVPLRGIERSKDVRQRGRRVDGERLRLRACSRRDGQRARVRRRRQLRCACSWSPLTEICLERVARGFEIHRDGKRLGAGSAGQRFERADLLADARCEACVQRSGTTCRVTNAEADWYAPRSARSTSRPVVTVDCAVRNVLAGQTNSKSSSTGATSPAPTRQSDSARACCPAAARPRLAAASRPSAAPSPRAPSCSSPSRETPSRLRSSRTRSRRRWRRPRLQARDPTDRERADAERAHQKSTSVHSAPTLALLIDT